MSGIQLSLRVETPPDGALQGIEMGVAPDGTAFLSQRGVATLAGTTFSSVTEGSQEVLSGASTPRARALRDLLAQFGWKGGPFYAQISHEGRLINAYPDYVVVAFLQYYAFHSRAPSERAVRALGLLATKSLRDLIYAALGIDQAKIQASFKAFYDRLMLNDVPTGYFSVFVECDRLMMAALSGGLEVGSHTVPDISVGQRWAAYWRENELSKTHGEALKHGHYYPDDHPQSRANGMPAAIYPNAALAEFRQWMDEQYIPMHFPKYLSNKVDEGRIQENAAAALIARVAPKKLGS